MKTFKPRFNAVEMAMIAAAIAVAAYAIGVARAEVRLAPYLTHSSQELRALEATYGPERHSEHGEEWILRDFFGSTRGGTFVDVGANDPQRFSNTYYLEAALGWSGIAIEPQTKFADAYARKRPATKFVPLFVSDVSNQHAVLHIPANNDLIASSSADFARQEGNGDVEPLQTNTTTLDDVLERSQVRSVDFLSIDVELHEPQVLRGFSIERYRPRLVCIESHPEVRQQILDYFAAHDYVLLGKYLRADSDNLWFTPFTARPD